VLTQLTLFPKYLALWLIPNPQWMSVDMRVPFALDYWSWAQWAGACAFVLYGVLTLLMLWRGGRLGLAGWLMAVPWVLFATELSSARIQEPFVLYRSYLWFATLGALLGMLLSARLPIKVWGAPAAAVVCLMVPLSWNRLATMENPVALWNDAAKLLTRGDEIGAGRIYYNRGLALRAARRTEEALEDFNRAIALHPKFAPVRDGRARVLYELKRYEEALRDINAAIALDTSRSSAYMDRGYMLHRLGRLEEASQDFRKACVMGQALACFAGKRMEPAENFR
jgi:tetratricopeptide (TPR) repeat protein